MLKIHYLEYLHTALVSSCNMPWIGLACTEDGRPAGGIVAIGATFLVFSFSFSSLVTDLNNQSKGDLMTITSQLSIHSNRSNELANYDEIRVKVRAHSNSR